MTLKVIRAIDKNGTNFCSVYTWFHTLIWAMIFYIMGSLWLNLFVIGFCAKAAFRLILYESTLTAIPTIMLFMTFWMIYTPNSWNGVNEQINVLHRPVKVFNSEGWFANKQVQILIDTLHHHYVMKFEACSIWWCHAGVYNAWTSVNMTFYHSKYR